MFALARIVAVPPALTLDPLVIAPLKPAGLTIVTFVASLKPLIGTTR